MLESIEEDHELDSKYDPETVENAISGMFITFQSLGEAIGPMAAATLADAYGFTVAQELYCGFLTFFWSAYFLSCGMCAMFGSDGVVDTTGSEETEKLVDKKESLESRRTQRDVEVDNVDSPS